MQEQTTVGFVKQKDGKGAVQNAVRLVGLKDVRILFGSRSNHVVGVVQHEDSVFFHQVILREALAPSAAVGGHGVSYC